MKKLVGAAGVLLLALGGFALGAQAADATPGQHLHPQKLCSPVKGGAECYAQKLVAPDGSTLQLSSPPSTGITPAQLQSAYKLTGLTSGGRTVAIIDAYGYPNLERDLGVYRTQFGLSACTKANGCLKIMDQNGGSSLPRFNAGWAGEQALDIDAVSASCPDCKIIVVQAKSASFTDLGTAAVTASKQSGVAAISNSYGGSDAPDTTYGKYYNFPGVAVTASTGDNGYQGASYPASSSYVTAVGGTTLAAAGNSRGWTETSWSGAGSGCSTLNAALPAAAAFGTGCSGRAMADVSAAADPNNGGLAVYYATTSSSSTWGQIGGTSESSPIISAVYALSGNTGGSANAIPYSHASALFDVTAGSNGTCPTTQWCTSGAGWDGPTGLGTPNGVGGF